MTERIIYASTIRDRMAAPREIVAGTTGGHYEGNELKAYDGRPGAMDAFKLPSLFMGRRVYRDANKGGAQ